MTLIILFWLSVFLIFHSYVLYPFIISLMSKGKKENTLLFSSEENLPFISILMAVHNEEMVMVDKVRSIYYTLYPYNKFEVLVGSDASTDMTNRICRIYSNNYKEFKFYQFNNRQGKPAIINKLVEEANGEILVLTDAKVFLEINTLFELVKHFKNPAIDIVGGHLKSRKVQKSGISYQENAFMAREIQMKYNEGLIWGKTMGVYGALYAIRKNAFSHVPANFSVDDFYITMKVLQKNKRAIMNLNALGFEEVPDKINTEFKRKVRISAGNWQNLRTFFKLLWPPWTALSFSFFSHKVIRWTGPFFMLISLITSYFLSYQNNIYTAALLFQTMLLSIPFIDLFLRIFNLHIIFLRFITHFYAMNVALLIGFIKNIFGKKTNIWQPTRR
jgi:cellulose synthase/poly-beta-1,6-N-acetylglucosamine synthase-like glycosyltransferase